LPSNLRAYNDAGSALRRAPIMLSQ
jgi:hypothetical protein